MKATHNLFLAAVLALVMAGLGVALDGSPDELTVMQLVADEVAALDQSKVQSK